MFRQTANGIALFAAAVSLCSQGVNAEDVPPPGPSNAERVITDSTVDVGHGSKSADLNVTLAPFGSIYETGFRIRLTPSYSSYQFKTLDSSALSSGYSLEGDILPGVGIATERASYIVLAGPAFVQSHDSGRTISQHAIKAVASVYATPTDQTMFYGSVNYITIRDGYQVQLKTGIKWPGSFYIGPEVKFSGSNGSSQIRYGAHVSAIKIGTAFVSITGGFLNDNQLGSGQFISVNFYQTF